MSKTQPSLFLPYRSRLLGTYTLTLLEYGLELMYPFTIGLAINGLIMGQGFWSVLPLTLVWISQVLVGALYQTISARVVANMYKTITAQVILRDPLNQSTSKTAARVAMVEKACVALSEVVPMFLNGLVGIIGSLIFLFIYDIRAGFISLLLVLAIGIIQLWFGKKALVINEQLNTLRESQVSVVESARKLGIASHFHAINRLTIRFKDLEAGTWTLSDICSLAAVIGVVIVVTQGGLYSAGSIYAAITYIMTLSDSLEHAPTLVDEGAHFYDVSYRIREELG